MEVEGGRLKNGDDGEDAATRLTSCRQKEHSDESTVVLGTLTFMSLLRVMGR